jgi:hypothetical protein
MLLDYAYFDDDQLCFSLHTPPRRDIDAGLYHLITKVNETTSSRFLYRLSHPLGEFAIETGRLLATPEACVVFDVSHHPARIAAIENIKGKSGWLVLQKLIIHSFEKEEYLLFSAIDDEGHSVDQDTCERMFRLPGRVEPVEGPSANIEQRLARESERHAKASIALSLESNNRFFWAERDKLERWADDMVVAAEKELADVKAQITASNRQARLVPTVEEQHCVQTKIRELEKDQRRLRQHIFDVEDDIKEKRDELIGALERRLAQCSECETLYRISWRVQ